MGGLFGGGSSGSGEKKIVQERNPPADTSGSNIPGDDKVFLANQRKKLAAQEPDASKTLLGKTSGVIAEDVKKSTTGYG